MSGPYRFVGLSPAIVSPDAEHWFVKPDGVPLSWFMEVIRLPVMTWQEHAQRSLYQSHMDPDCWPQCDGSCGSSPVRDHGADELRTM